MTDYAKIALTGTYSKDSTYTPAKVFMEPADYAVTPDEWMHLEVQADTGSTTVTTSHLASATALVVKNADSTNYVTAKFYSAANSSTLNQVQVAAGGFLVITDFTVASNLALVANSAAVECEVLIFGS